MAEDTVKSTAKNRERAAASDLMFENITLKMTSSLEVGDVLNAVVDGLLQEMNAAAVSVWLLEEDSEALHLGAHGGLDFHGGLDTHSGLPARLASVARGGEHFCTNRLPTDGSVGSPAWLLENGLRALAGLPLIFRDRSLGVLAIYFRHHLEERDFERLFLFARTAAVAIQNARLYSEVERLNTRLSAENQYLQDEIYTDNDCGGIVGRSEAIQHVLSQIDQVAQTDATVLIEGATGTGKELVARTIHERSRRSDRPMVKVNCGAISAGLVESELFGHEKGAFTGALDRRIGRFELADGGTLFLDEVGELPLETQVKLLRALQEQEFERVGNSQPIRVDVRIIAAGNRDLAGEVESGRFRADLFYRLNVFPIQVPALLERPDDIPLIAACALGKIATRVGKEVFGMSPAAAEFLQSYSWPGNVRELLNVLERAVILARGEYLEPQDFALPKHPSLLVSTTSEAAPSAQVPTLETLAAVESRHVQSVLEHTSWVIDGPKGAARILDLHPNTLRSRLKKLGIERPS